MSENDQTEKYTRFICRLSLQLQESQSEGGRLRTGPNVT